MRERKSTRLQGKSPITSR